MKLKKIFKLQGYVQRLKLIEKKIAVRRLIKDETIEYTINEIWDLGSNVKLNSLLNDLSEYNIFGTPINLNNINWHKDYVSRFEYPVKRFDRIKISKWFDKGIDVKFPWEVSRFYFAIKLATNKTNNNYLLFKKLILDWIEKNPFCYGVNWVCTMEVAIRTINWIIAINIFGDIFQKDGDFKETISKLLIQHAEYISAFPEIYENGHTTNHTTADYTGLLFLALTLKEHPKSERWLKQAIEGLEECIRYQTYEDGVNFEASIPYHRLVLEMFAYSAVVAKANGIEFSKRYYELLFKMFEYTAAYMDHNGNAPQVGDNDSGRILIFHESDEHDHSYLLDLGEHIFNYKFKSQCKKRNPELRQWLPKINKINIEELNVEPRETNKSIAFEKGGAYFLKNENVSLMVACFPIGQNGIGGHNHFDMGSFTLSYKGQAIVVDSGTYTYTRSKQDRDKFRGLGSHNVVMKNIDKNICCKDEKIWGLSKYSEFELTQFDERTMEIKINNLKNHYSIIRNFKLTDTNKLAIKDECEGEFYSILHFLPDIVFTNKLKDENSFQVITFPYSKRYGSKTISSKIIIKGKNLNYYFLYIGLNNIIDIKLIK